MTRLEEISKRYEAATPGPWFADLDEDKACVIYITEVGPGNREFSSLIMRDSEYISERDNTFIAHSREDIPWLVEVVETWREAYLAHRAYKNNNTGENTARYRKAKDKLAEMKLK